MISEPSNYRGRDGRGDFMITTGQPVYVHRNLHTPAGSIKYSARSMGGAIPKNRVFHHAASFYLTGVEFRVQGSGFRLFQETGKRTVHAGVVGSLQAWRDLEWPSYAEVMDDPAWGIVAYNPRLFYEFEIQDKWSHKPAGMILDAREAMIGRWGDLRGLPEEISGEKSLVIVRLRENDENI